MDERKIKKENRVVLFKLSDGSEVEGEVFLRLYEAHHSGPQRVGDLLNEERPFIPVKTDRGVVLLNVSHIVSAKIQSVWESDELMTMGKRQSIRIKTAHEQEIPGDIFINLPDGYCRVKDYINQPILFFPLFQPDYIIYINRRFILLIQD
jgi:hypothetical protein